MWLFDHVMPLASASHDAIYIGVMWCPLYWCKHHGMQTASLMEPFHSLGQDYQNEILYDFLCHVTLLAPAFCTINPLHSLGKDNWNEVEHDFFGHVTPWCWQQHHIQCWCHHHVMLTTLSLVPLHSLGQHDWNKVQHDLFGHVTSLVPVLALCNVASSSHDADDIINGTTAFLILGQFNWDAICLF